MTSPSERLHVVVVSPHLDDAALSCAGAIARMTAAGADVLVATVFTADRPASAPLSAAARRNHARWGGGDRPFERRRAEDDEAMRVLHARRTHLGLPDVIYRTDSHGVPLSTHVPLHPDDVRETLPAIRGALAPFLVTATDVLCPLGMGRQADHALVREAVEQIADPVTLVYYEEYPYVARKDAAQPEDVPPDETTLVLDEAGIETRAAAIACYRTQLRGLFPTATERALEVLCARAPFLWPLLLPAPAPGALAARVSRRVAADAASLGGERYRRSAAGRPWPFEQPERDARHSG